MTHEKEDVTSSDFLDATHNLNERITHLWSLYKNIYENIELIVENQVIHN